MNTPKPEVLAEAIMHAILSLPHEIHDNKLVIKLHPHLSGKNTLAQLDQQVKGMIHAHLDPIDAGGNAHTDQKSGVDLIAEERQRQISKEGYSPEHDDRHAEGELSAAAECYAHVVRLRELGYDSLRAKENALQRWPWEPESWKPSEDLLRNLAKAGALIAAEMDRLLRARKSAS